MKVLVIGHTGLIGSAVLNKLLAAGIPTIGANLESEPGINIESSSSIKAFLNHHNDISDIICAAGRTGFGNFYEMTESDFDLGVNSKLLGQIHLTMEALKRDSIKSVTLTSGTWSHTPAPGTVAAAFVNGGIESFVKAANIDLHNDKRLNVVSPGWTKESMKQLGLDASQGVDLDDVVNLYLHALRSKASGKTFELGNFSKIEHANLVVTDIEQTKDFLQTAFPMWRVRGEGEGTWNGKPRRWLHLGTDHYYITLNDNGEGLNRDLQGHQPGLAHIGFVVDDGEEILSRLNAKGYELRILSEDSPYRRSYYFVDPQGFEFEFVEYSSEIPSEKNDYATP